MAFTMKIAMKSRNIGYFSACEKHKVGKSERSQSY
jgi:hypothetical protein